MKLQDLVNSTDPRTLADLVDTAPHETNWEAEDAAWRWRTNPGKAVPPHFLLRRFLFEAHRSDWLWRAPALIARNSRP